MAAAIRRHSDAIGYDAFRVPGLLLEAWVAERRQDGAAAIEALPARARARGARRVRRARGVRSRRARLDRARERRSRARPRSSSGRHSPPPRRPKRRWPRRMQASSSPASLRGAEMRRTAERQYRQVLERSQTPAAAPGARDPLRRPRRQPGHGSAARARRAGRRPRRHRLGGRAAPARGPRAHLSWQNRRRGWQSVGIGGPEPSCCQTTRTGGSI